MLARLAAIMVLAFPVALTAQKPETLSPETVKEVFSEARILIRKAFGVKITESKLNPEPGTSAREAVIAHFHELYRELEPEFEVLPVKTDLDPRLSRQNLSPEAIRQLEQLLCRRMLPPSGPLTFDGDPTEAELGRSLGYFIIAISEARHVADPKFSPIYSN